MVAQIKKKIKILLVEDSRVQREYIIHILDGDPDLQVIAHASNGLEALDLLKTIKPDVILTDLHMPKMNGIEMIQEIMKSTPLPIIANSSSSSLDEMINGFNALKAGAVAFAEKPRGVNDPRSKTDIIYLLEVIKLMSEVAVVKRKNIGKSTVTNSNYQNNKNITAKSDVLKNRIEVIVIGVSTGGPLVLQNIISNLKTDFPPILIVQHIATGFIIGLTEWLMQTTRHIVHVANDGDNLERGHIYFAPDHCQIGIRSNLSVQLVQTDNNHLICPSVSHLFNTVAKNLGDKALGILLTGMGCDGAQELKLMRDSGAVTVAQDKETSLIFGMPAKAIEMNAATYIMSPVEISELINTLSIR